MSDTIDEFLVTYLTDVHALEQQSIELLEKAIDIAGDPSAQQLYHGHLLETHEQKRYIRERLEAHGAGPSTTKDVASRAGAKGIGLTVQAAPDTPGKLAAFAFAFEHLEIASYELLRRLAARAGDGDTVEIADRILGEERSAADKIAATFDLVVERALQQRGLAG
jgi:ferritin-like metal-binding protein YciE